MDYTNMQLKSLIEDCLGGEVFPSDWQIAEYLREHHSIDISDDQATDIDSMLNEEKNYQMRFPKLVRAYSIPDRKISDYF